MSTNNTVFPWTFPVTFDIYSTIQNPERGLVDILNNIPENSTNSNRLTWNVTKPPVIEHASERTAKARHNEKQDAIYIFSDTDGDVERLSADGDDLTRYQTIELQVWTMEADDFAPRCTELQEELIRLLGNLMDDNKDQTDQNNIEPTGRNDARNESSPRRSEHTVMGVTIDTHRYLPLNS